MELCIGKQIQAIDELGRWENGEIIGEEDGDQAHVKFLVKFLGWGAKYNIWVSPAEIREPVQIFEAPGSFEMLDEMLYERTEFLCKIQFY